MRTVVGILFVILLAASGCWPHAPFELVPEPAPATTAAAPAPPRPAVTPEQVNASNAHEMAQALLEEIDREQTAKAK